MFNNGVDQGYRDNPRWWFEGPDAFRIADLDKDYPAEYFPLAEPPKRAVDNIVKYVFEYYQKITGMSIGRRARQVIDFGTGGGWTVDAVERQGYICDGIEGSYEGHLLAADRDDGSGSGNQHRDLRFVMQEVNHKWEVAICTEVAEHLEIPFHGILVTSLTRTSDLIWFSSEDPEVVQNRAHLHHPGEMPLRYWQNLFAFYGYGCYMLPDEVFNAAEGRGRCIFYNKATYPELK